VEIPRPGHLAGRTTACSRLPPASAALPLPAAAEAQRSAAWGRHFLVSRMLRVRGRQGPTW